MCHDVETLLSNSSGECRCGRHVTLNSQPIFLYKMIFVHYLWLLKSAPIKSIPRIWHLCCNLWLFQSTVIWVVRHEAACRLKIRCSVYMQFEHALSYALHWTFSNASVVQGCPNTMHLSDAWFHPLLTGEQRYCKLHFNDSASVMHPTVLRRLGLRCSI